MPLFILVKLLALTLVTLRAPCNLELGVEMYRELYRLAGLQSGYEPYFLTVSGVKKHFGVLFKSLLTHTRCELY